MAGAAHHDPDVRLLAAADVLLHARTEEEVAEALFAELAPVASAVALSVVEPGAELARPVRVQGAIRPLERATCELEWSERAARIPLGDGERRVGLLAIERGDHAWGDDVRRFVLTLARLATNSLQRVRSERRAEQLQRVLGALADAMTIDEVARVTTVIARETLGLTSAAVWTVDASGDFVLTGVSGPPERFMEQFRHVPKERDIPLTRVARSREALWVESEINYRQASQDIAAAASASWRLVPYAALPLLVDGRLLGVVSFTHDHWRRFVEEDRRFLLGVAAHCARALDRARSYAAEIRARERLSRLHEVTAALSRARTTDDVAAVTCRLGAEAMEAHAGVLWLAHGDGSFHLVGSWGTPREWLEPWRVVQRDDASAPLTGVVATREPLWIESDDDYRARAGSVYEAARAHGRLSSLATLPLIDDGHVVGVVAFAHPLGHRYDEADRAFYAALALECAQAIGRAHLLDASRAATRAAEDASRVKDQFLAMLGHELRNPLAPIRTALTLMKKEHASRELAVVERQVLHIERLIGDLLDVSRITAGRIELEKTRFDIGDAVGRAVEMATPLIEQRRHRVEIDVAPDLLVDGDLARVAQVFANLLVNAARYTPEGSYLSLRAAARGDLVEVRVDDDGPGFPPSLLPRVFELFTQAPQGSDRKHGGLGLGLAIARSLVALHGGTIEARNREPGGAEVVVRLPRAEAERRSLEEPRASHVERKTGRVLVVDDNVDAAELLCAWLECSGFEARMAHDAVTALSIADEFAPDVGIFDIGLPIIDGCELARRLRARPQYRDLPLLALTGYSQSSDRARTREAGFVEHLVKPVNLERLAATLSSLLDRARPTAANG